MVARTTSADLMPMLTTAKAQKTSKGNICIAFVRLLVNATLKIYNGLA